MEPTAESLRLRDLLRSKRAELSQILKRYSATSPRIFGSVARGTAVPGSDIDLIVDLTPGKGNDVLRIAGIAEELSQLLEHRVDVVSDSVLRGGVSKSAKQDLVEV